MPSKKTELAWAAGFLDGEGYFYAANFKRIVKRKQGKDAIKKVWNAK